MNDSICFSCVPANALNEKAHEIDPRLYLFAYYEPKPLEKNDNARIQFFTAIINLYGLLWDCGPFVHKSLMRSLKDNPLANILPDVEWQKKKLIVFRCQDLADIVSAFRSISCHNSSGELLLNREHFKSANDWIHYHCHIYHSYDELTQDDWNKMISQLVVEANCFVEDIENCLDILSNCRDTPRFEIARESWLKAIARNYLTNPELLLSAMAEFYQMYLDTMKIDRKYNVPLRVLTIQWLADYFQVDRKHWSQHWLDEVENLGTSKVYQLLQNWQAKWEEINPSNKGIPCEAVMPASSFFLILANDVYQFAQNPNTYTF